MTLERIKQDYLKGKCINNFMRRGRGVRTKSGYKPGAVLAPYSLSWTKGLIPEAPCAVTYMEYDLYNRRTYRGIHHDVVEPNCFPNGCFIKYDWVTGLHYVGYIPTVEDLTASDWREASSVDGEVHEKRYLDKYVMFTPDV